MPLKRKTPLRPKRPMARGSATLRRTRPLPKVNRKRKALELLRTYGPAERRAWITSFCCLTCGHPPKSEQSHLRSRSGAGRKGDAAQIVPMCRGCHTLYPQRSKWRRRFPHWTDAELERAAAAFEHAWQHGLSHVALLNPTLRYYAA